MLNTEVERNIEHLPILSTAYDSVHTTLFILKGMINQYIIKTIFSGVQFIQVSIM